MKAQTLAPHQQKTYPRSRRTRNTHTPIVAVPLVGAGRWGGTASLEPEEGALAAILRRTDDVGVEDVGCF